MSDVHDRSRVPAGIGPRGGQFAQSTQVRSAVALETTRPAPADADELRSSRQIAKTILGLPGGTVDRMVEHVYGDLLWRRGAPTISEEARVAAQRAANTAVVDKRRDAILKAADDPDAGDEGETAYLAMLPIIDAEMAGDFDPSEDERAAAAADLARRRTVTDLMGMSGTQFWAHKHAESEAEDNAGCPSCSAEKLHQGRCLVCEPPTRAEVEQARDRLRALGPRVRPMYRDDWERRTGGRGPTVAEHRTQFAFQHEVNAEIDRARHEYETLRDAHAASDQSQDQSPGANVVCRNCGHRFDAYQWGGRCPTCAVDA